MDKVDKVDKMVRVTMKGVGIWQPGHPCSVCPGREESQRLGQRQIDDHPIEDNGEAYAYHASAFMMLLMSSLSRILLMLN